MLVLISPSKTLDFSDNQLHKYSQARLLAQSGSLIDILKKKKLEELKKLMSISDNLAELNADRYKSFSLPFNPDNAKVSILAFKGDVYTGFDAPSLTEEQLLSAQSNLRILSGLYGLLRPLDLIQAYRLEMGTRLQNEKGKDLYQFWGDQITELINEDVEKEGHQYILNLASNEYFKAVNKKKLTRPLIEVNFRELRNGAYKFISFNAKKARGVMARYVVENQVKDINEIKAFNRDGYLLNDELSSESNLIFTK